MLALTLTLTLTLAQVLQQGEAKMTRYGVTKRKLQEAALEDEEAAQAERSASVRRMAAKQALMAAWREARSVTVEPQEDEARGGVA